MATVTHARNWTFSACFEDDSETSIDLLRLDPCTLDPLGLLRNFLERHSTSGSGCLLNMVEPW